MADVKDRDLIRLYWPVELRPAFDALFAIDDVMGEIVASSTQATLGAIRLAWWREALERLDASPPPPEPRLQAVARELVPRGVTGASLAGIEAGWAALLAEEIDGAQVDERGIALFGACAVLLNADDERLRFAGQVVTLIDAARRGFAVDLETARIDLLRIENYRFARGVRPISVWAALAGRDIRMLPRVEPEATPGRAWTLIRHRLTGRI